MTFDEVFHFFITTLCEIRATNNIDEHSSKGASCLLGESAQKVKLTYLLIDVLLCITRLLQRFSILILLNRTWLSFFDIFISGRDATTFGQLLWFEFTFSKPYFVRFSTLILDHHAWLCVRIWQDAATL